MNALKTSALIALVLAVWLFLVVEVAMAATS